MGGFIENFKRGLAGDEKCTSGLTLLGLDWANRSAHLLICTKCSHISGFLERPVRI
jgi:hypothetical protein